MDVRLHFTDGDAEDPASLAAWLGDEQELRGHVEIIGAPIEPQYLGSLPDLITVAVGAGGAGTVLASSVATWLQTRKTTAKLTVATPDKSVTLDIATVEDVRPLLEQILKQIEGRGTGESGSDTATSPSPSTPTPTPTSDPGASVDDEA